MYLPLHVIPGPVAHAGYSAPIDGTFLAFFLAIFFIPVMFGFFARGLGEFYDWFQVRGWRPEHLRKPLK